MKKIYLFLFLASCLTLMSQTPRMCLYEMFTGENCPPAAAQSPAVNALLALPSNASKMVTINWEVPLPSTPTISSSLYQTNKLEIDWRYKSTSAGGYGYNINFCPAGLIDGQAQTVFGAANGVIGNMNSTVIATAQSYSSAFSVSINNAWDATYSSVNLTISILATANFSATGPLVFRTVMIERNVDFSVAPGYSGQKHFEHVAVASFPSIQTGVPLSGNWTTAQNLTFTLNCVIPAYVRNKSELAFVGFIQDDGNRRVLQAAKSNVPPIENDLKVIALNSPLMTCSSSAYSPTLLVQNTGSTSATVFTISSLVNAVPRPPFIWTGILNPGDTAKVALPALNGPPLISGNNVIQCNVLMNGDLNIVNNNVLKPLFVPIPILAVTANALQFCVGELVTLTGTGADQYEWGQILNGANNISFTAVESTTILVTGTNTLTQCASQVMFNLVVTPCLSIEENETEAQLEAFPNPVKDILTLNAPALQGELAYTVTDLIGKVLVTGKITEETTQIDFSALQSGVYFITVGEWRTKVIK